MVENTHVPTEVEGWLKELHTFRVHQAAKPVEGDDEENGEGDVQMWKCGGQGVVEDSKSSKSTTVHGFKFMFY